MRIRQAFLLFVLLGFASGCASVARRYQITELNRVFRVRANQTFFTQDSHGKVTKKTLNYPAKAALYQEQDTLYAEFVSTTLRASDNDPTTIDQADSMKTLFVHYNPRVNFVEEKSPWFYYQLTTFDIDLFTIPFKYRFSTAGRPGQLSTSANVGVYAGIRFDLGRYRNIYYRRDQHSDIQSFSFGIGTVLSIDPVLVNGFNTAGRVTDEYEALGVNYGLATIFGYKRVTAGLVLGFENLADRNNRLWVYRQKPWLGLMVGININ
ncbi:hypothetical protein [Larkinella humicola]|uniref:Outer membrane protein with beta-barrel domain n=1 Tax=Larkinella humicola TaxID=2607654 RepID=A0A5N1JE51_9BACT|nr:hypothetical protein [Larkinella humicola]KAA9350004.1 hypothetical protein F0P93_21460 [Larkinella humicola]